MATVDVEVHTTIERMREHVASFACDPDNVTAWQANIEAVQQETDGPLMLGSRLRFTSGFLGRVLEYTYEVVELVAGERLVLRCDAHPFQMETTYAFEDAPGDATWMTVRHRGDPTAYRGLAGPVIATAVRRATSGDLARLKRILEAC